MYQEQNQNHTKAFVMFIAVISLAISFVSLAISLLRYIETTGNREFIDGVRIIEESYQPIDSRLYIRCEQRQADAAWENIPLGMTEA